MTIDPADILDNMSIPAHFAADERAVDDLLTHHGAADLITATPGGLVATMLPFVYDPGMRTLRGHLARNNDQWRRPVELLITRIEAKFKLSQNRPAADVDGVISGLITNGHEDAAQAVQRARTA